MLHAPNVHVGGGFFLLQYILDACPATFSWMQLDLRIKDYGSLKDSSVIYWVRKSVWFRLLAEWRLYCECTSEDTVLCFHGLPPLFRLRGNVVVFVQNRLLFESKLLRGYSFLIRLRILGERWWIRLMYRNCNRFIVQTPSMARAVKGALGDQVNVSMQPFISRIVDLNATSSTISSEHYDFIYIASGEAHKNHVNLLLAWDLLASSGLKPSLALTVDVFAYPKLSKEIEMLQVCSNLSIFNLGNIPRTKLPIIFKSCSAMIYPSKLESLGLPLIEASNYGLPILASELDFVRDVIEPVETFDPDSPTSIARAVKRFLGKVDPPIPIGSAKEFLYEVLR